MYMKAFRAISSLLLAILVLMSSTSFLVGMHFCGGEVRSVSLFVPADQCPGHQAPAPACHKHMSDCCKDEVVLHNGEDFKHSVSNPETTASLTLEVSTPPVVVSETIPSFSYVRTFSTYYPPTHSTDTSLDIRVLRI